MGTHSAQVAGQREPHHARRRLVRRTVPCAFNGAVPVLRPAGCRRRRPGPRGRRPGDRVAAQGGRAGRRRAAMVVPHRRLPEQNVSPSGRSLHATRGKFRPRPPDDAARVALVKPFVLLATRPEDAAADGEYEAMLRFGGLGAEQLVRVRLEAGPLPPTTIPEVSGIVVGGSPFTTSEPEHTKSDVPVSYTHL